MTHFAKLPKFVGLITLGAALVPGAASALVLDTTALKANSVFALSDEASFAMSLTGTNISALGNSTQLSGGASDGIASFNLPVTKVDVSLGLPLFGGQLITPNSGDATGSALLISRGNYNLTLANFVIDYKTSLVLADITTNGVTAKGTSLYSFTATNLTTGLSGLSLNMHQQLSNLVLTSSAQASFTSGLHLQKLYADTIKTLDFGTITIDINTALRQPVSDKPYVASVPEAPSVFAMALGLLGIAAASRRKAPAQLRRD